METKLRSLKPTPSSRRRMAISDDPNSFSRFPFPEGLLWITAATTGGVVPHPLQPSSQTVDNWLFPRLEHFKVQLQSPLLMTRAVFSKYGHGPTY